MKRIAGSGIKSWELTDELWEQVKDFIPQRKQDLPEKSWSREEINTTAPGAGSHLLCAANRYSVEGVAQRIRSGQQYP
jgi:hypothetical protein